MQNRAQTDISLDPDKKKKKKMYYLKDTHDGFP